MGWQAVLTQEQFKRNKELTQHGRKLETRGFYLTISGLGLPLVAVVISALLDIPMAEPLNIPLVVVGSVGVLMFFIGFLILNTSRKYSPTADFTLLTCPCCGKERPLKEFERRFLHINYFGE